MRKKEAVENVPRSRWTLTRLIKDIQLKTKQTSLTLAPQFLIFTPGLQKEFEIMEQLAAMRWMNETTTEAEMGQTDRCYKRRLSKSGGENISDFWRQKKKWVKWNLNWNEFFCIVSYIRCSVSQC